MEEWIKLVKNVPNGEELERLWVEITGKKGFLTTQFAMMKSIPDTERKEFASKLNAFRDEISALLEERQSHFDALAIEQKLQAEKIDVSMIRPLQTKGARHPISMTMEKIIEYFNNQNFEIKEGPFVEDDFHNFEALNLPKYHPARDMQDTFYFKDSMLLRTHTSPVQIRTMLSEKPPIRIISPGRVFRRDFDITHTPMFNQVEGLVVDSKDVVSFAHLKSMLEGFLKHMFGDIEVRFRPSFFPFTEPSAEADISCVFCHGDGCRVCKQTGWLEVLGCGIVDENVFNAVGYKDVSGYAFGLGVERFAMLLHEIGDLRSMYESDVRLLEQFR